VAARALARAPVRERQVRVHALRELELLQGLLVVAPPQPHLAHAGPPLRVALGSRLLEQRDGLFRLAGGECVAAVLEVVRERRRWQERREQREDQDRVARGPRDITGVDGLDDGISLQWLPSMAERWTKRSGTAVGTRPFASTSC